MASVIRKLLHRMHSDQRGYFVGTALAVFFLIAFSLFFAEYFRIMDHREEVENIIQRGINVALEDTLRDPQRWDFRTEVDGVALLQRLNTYLRSEMGLDNQLRRRATDGRVVFQIVFTHQHVYLGAGTDNPHLSVEGNVVITSYLSFIAGDIALPFRIRSRSFRMD